MAGFLLDGMIGIVDCMTVRAKTLSITIRCAPEKVYAYASNPLNLPHWAPAFCLSVHKVNEDWIIQSPAGPMKVRFVEPNPYGILDHTVTVMADVEVFVPMRVFSNGNGSEVVFTIFQEPYRSDTEFAQDVGMVERDLQTLKKRMEA